MGEIYWPHCCLPQAHDDFGPLDTTIDRIGRHPAVDLPSRDKALTCEVRVSGKQPYDVCVVPHWDVSSSVIETFQRPAGALRRHAELASYLRQEGWS